MQMQLNMYMTGNLEAFSAHPIPSRSVFYSVEAMQNLKCQKKKKEKKKAHPTQSAKLRTLKQND